MHDPLGNFNFTIVPDAEVSGFYPHMGTTGSKVTITGESLKYTTGVALVDDFHDEAQLASWSLHEGDSYWGGTDVISGTIPYITSHIGSRDSFAIRVYSSLGHTTPGMAPGGAESSDRFKVIEPTCTFFCDADFSGSLKVRDIPYDGLQTGFLAKDEDGNIVFRQLNVQGVTDFNAASITLSAGSGLVGGGDLTQSRTFDIGAGTGIIVKDNDIHVDTGNFSVTGDSYFDIVLTSGLHSSSHGPNGDRVYMTDSLELSVGAGTGIIVTDTDIHIDTGQILSTTEADSRFLQTGDGYFNVNAGPGLTGDIKVYMGEALDLGVFVDGETINFTGSQGDEIGAFTVMDGGITPEKVSFWDELVLKTGEQFISGNKYFHGTGTFTNLFVQGLLTATGDGIWVSDLSISGKLNHPSATGKYVRMTGIRWNDTFSTTEKIDYQDPQSTEGAEITGLSISPSESGHSLIIDTELNLSAGNNSEAIIALFKDDEATPRRAWSNNIYAREYGQVVRMRHVHVVETTGEQSWKIRVGRRLNQNGTIYLNRTHYYGANGPSNVLGGKAYSNMTIEEIREYKE
jgi:hypothetical protein